MSKFIRALEPFYAVLPKSLSAIFEFRSSVENNPGSYVISEQMYAKLSIRGSRMLRVFEDRFSEAEKATRGESLNSFRDAISEFAKDVFQTFGVYKFDAGFVASDIYDRVMSGKSLSKMSNAKIWLLIDAVNSTLEEVSNYRKFTPINLTANFSWGDRKSVV